MLRGNKPFSDYRRKSPYSPYLSLLRTRDTAEGINNYYEYVKPRLEAQQESRQVNRQIQGLQDTARYGAQTTQQQLQQLKQRPGTVLPSTPQRAPATFMNYQQFFQQGRR